METEDQVLTGTDEADTIVGGGGADSLSGGGDNDILRGGAGNDSLAGGRDDDILDGGAGDDVLNGGPGNDTATFEDATNGVTANLASGTATGEGIDILNGIENLTGTPFDDTLIGDGGPNRLLGRGGNDVLDGGAGADTLQGDAGADRLTATEDDTLIGGIGADVFDLSGVTGEATVVDPTPADRLRIANTRLDADAVTTETIARGGEARAVLRIDRDGDDETDASIVLSRLAQANIAHTTTDDGGTAVTLDTQDLPFTDLSIRDQISALYVGVLDRAPDAEGLDFWVDEYTDARSEGIGERPTIERIADAFLKSVEAQDLDATETLRTAPADPDALGDAIDVLYDRFLGRDPAETGTSFWTDTALNRIENGRTLGSLVVDMAAGALDSPMNTGPSGDPTLDATTLRNRIEVAQQFANAMDSDGVDLGNGITLDDLRAPLDGMTQSFVRFQDGIEQVQSLVADADTGDMDGM